MSDDSSSSALQGQNNSRRRSLRSHRNPVTEGGGSDNEVVMVASEQNQQPPRRRSTRSCPKPTSTDIAGSTETSPASISPASPEAASPADQNTGLLADSLSRGREPRWSLFERSDRSRRGRDSAVGSPSRGNLSPRRRSFDNDGAPNLSSHDIDLSLALEDGLLGGDTTHHVNVNSPLTGHLRSRPAAPGAHPETSTPKDLHTDSEFPTYAFDDFYNYSSDHASSSAAFERMEATARGPAGRTYPTMGGSSKRSRDKYENADGRDMLNTLKRQGAVSAILHHNTASDPAANDVWPNFRSAAKLPARYALLDMGHNTPQGTRLDRNPQQATQKWCELQRQTSAPDVQVLDQSDKGRPLWQLPVELVEQILLYLNRDDVKSLRLVSRELNEYTSQAIFKTVVVPFNTEIYGMLGQEPKLDRKGKKRAKISRPEYWWKNANGDEVYNGHGLDVFCGFGRHILKYGMSFEVNEDSLSCPPLKLVTETKTSFWGNYDWPFEEYRRFDTVAGLESAADETPRMKIAFSELTKVKELALSVDSGLGWLNGPDRSIRARILHKPRTLFGSRQGVPDRRTQAQYELWNHIEASHHRAGDDIRTASLYRLDGIQSLTDVQEAGLLAAEQPEMPFLDPRIINEATPHNVTDGVPSQSLEDPDRPPPLVNAGVLFTSTTLQHSDAGQLMSPIIPATLVKAQKEWLLETEWAQRAFMSSYMLSIIDNPTTFHPVHTLNISSLSDRYISMLNRADFWTALPNLTNVTLMVIPGWRAVNKDGAGFVDTPRVDPTDKIDAFCQLLRTQIASRPRISKLTVGFTTGGEHAEGLHARNKLLMPAPVLPLRVRTQFGSMFPPAETATIQDAKMLQQALLRFPYVEELTLRNCWVTPPALLHFVKVHDVYSLKHLTLDSVSLTAILRLNGNGQVPQLGQQVIAQNAALPPHMAGVLGQVINNQIGGNGPGQAQGLQLPANNQLLNLYIQSLIVQLQQLQANAGGAQQQNHITALQTQLQQQLQNAQTPNQQGLTPPQAQNAVQQTPQGQQQLNFTQMTHLNNLVTQVHTIQQQMVAGQFAPVAAPVNAPTGATDSILQMQPRRGSWMNIIDQISPGTNLLDFESEHSQADVNRSTSLQSIEFVSCGYAKLPHFTSVDQGAIEAATGFAAALRNPIFTKRYNALSPAMLSSKYQYLGEIVQEVDLSEFAALDACWNLRHGWEDAEAARAAEFDGLLSGGTGRFTGKVQRSDRVTNEPDAAS